MELAAQRPECTIATIEDIVCLVWHGRPSLEGIRETSDAIGRASKRHETAGVGYLTVVEVAAADQSPPGDVRDAIDAMLLRFDRSLRASALVFEGVGFRSAMVRSVVALITRAHRRSFPHTVFATLPPAVDWLIARMGLKVPAAELQGSVNGLRVGRAA